MMGLWRLWDGSESGLGLRTARFRGGLVAAGCLLLASCGNGSSSTADAEAGDPFPAGPWISLLSPPDPSIGDLDLWLRVGHERSLPVDLTLEFRVVPGDWQPATVDDPSALFDAASAPEAGRELSLRWRSTADIPGDAEFVQLRVTATDGELDALPVETSIFTVLNFFENNPSAVLITEISTAERNVPGPRVRDDYVELHNTTGEDLTLDGWRLVITSSSGTRGEYPLDDCVLPAHGWRTLVEDDPEQDSEYTGGWPLAGVALPWTNEGYGSAALVATYDRAVDFVRWGGSPARPPDGTEWVDEVPLRTPQTLTVLNRADEETDTDRSADFCIAHPSPDEASTGCLPHLPLGSVLVTELDSQSTDDQIEVLNASGAPVDLAGWVVLWDGDDLGAGFIPLASWELPDGGRLGLRDNGTTGHVSGGIMELGANMNIDGLVPTAVGLQDPYGDVIDFLAAAGSTIRWTDWNDTHATPTPGPGTSLSRRPGDPDTDSADDFCLTAPNIGAAPDACLEPLGIDLRISEVKPGRSRTVAAWVEIYNPGPDPVDLSQVYLSYTVAGSGNVGDFPLAGTLDPGALLVLADRDVPELPGSYVLSGRMRIYTNVDTSIALRDIHGFGIDYVGWGEPPGVALWPDVWTGIAADLYPTSEQTKSLQRHPHDAPDTDTREDWCWADMSPSAPNLPCE